MSLRFCLKQSLRIFIQGIYFNALSFAQPPSASITTYPGLFQTVDKLIKVNKFHDRKIRERLKMNPVVPEQLENISNISLDPIFLKSLFFHSKSRFLNLSSQKECFFYSFIEHNLINSGILGKKEIPISYTIQKNSARGLISYNNFFEFIHRSKCPQNKSINLLFKKKKIKNTLKKLSLPVPDNQLSCIKIFKKWQSHEWIAPLCRISQKIQSEAKNKEHLAILTKSEYQKKELIEKEILQASAFKKLLTPFQQNYLSHLCGTIDVFPENQDFFCNRFLSISFWKKIAKNNINRKEMTVKCHLLLKKNNLDHDDLINCADQLSQNKNSCHYLETKTFPALAPSPDCDEISEALHFSKLQAPYQDCPGKVDNEGIVNTSRVISHFNPQDHKINKNTCNDISVLPFIEINFNNSNKDAWNFHLCYDDPIEDKKICLPVIIGHSEKSKYSELRVVETILKRTVRAPKSIECSFVKENDYNPDRLKYRDRCFLIYNKDRCTNISCPKKIIFRDKEITHIKYQGEPSFDYFPNSTKNTKKSISFLIEKTRKGKFKSIKHLTALKYFLKLSPLSLVHGMGCIEDVYPQNFKKTYINQCQPIAFIIDGTIEKKQYWLCYHSNRH